MLSPLIGNVAIFKQKYWLLTIVAIFTKLIWNLNLENSNKTVEKLVN